MKSYVYLQIHVLDIHVHVFTPRFCMHEKLQYANLKSLHCTVYIHVLLIYAYIDCFVLFLCHFIRQDLSIGIKICPCNLGHLWNIGRHVHI